MSIYSDSYDRGLQDAAEGREPSARRADLGFDARGYRHGYVDGQQRRLAGPTGALPLDPCACSHPRDRHGVGAVGAYCRDCDCPGFTEVRS